MQKRNENQQKKAAMKQRTLDHFGVQIEALIKQPERLYLHALLATNSSFLIAENPVLRNFLNIVAPTFVQPSRRTLANTFLTYEYQAAVRDIQEMVAKCGKISITTDGTTKGLSKPFWAITLHGVDADFVIHSRLAACLSVKGSHTGQRLANVITN